MAIACTHCKRINSADARYCYYDGVSLMGAPGPVSAPKTFLAPFVFPAGVSCKNIDELAIGCQWNWDTAVDLLQKGRFQQFFNGMGRKDLAQIAQEAAASPDRDRGLDQLLARLPSVSLSPAKLEVQPKLTNLGTLKVGENSLLELTLENQGSRLIFGSISSNCNWLNESETGEAKLFQFRDSATITIQVKGQHLRAGNKPLEGNLFIESNAGTFNLKVIAHVPIQAFPEGCLAGARSPRELAAKAKKDSRAAGALFECGAVARWYLANGWTYPVPGPASNGMAAVQQFFEALGLSKPPKVFITQPHLHLQGPPGARLTRQIQVRSEEQRPVYASATSTAGWCVVKPGLALGNAVTLPVEIVVPQEAGQIVHALIRVTSNGLQRFDIPVQLTVETPATAVAAATVAAPILVSAASPAMSQTLVKSQADDDFAHKRKSPSAYDPVKLLAHLLPLVILVLVMLGLVAKDVFSEAPKQPQVAVSEEESEGPHGNPAPAADFKVAIQDEPDEGPIAPPAARFTIADEPEERFAKLPPPPVKVEIKDEPAETGPAQSGGKGVALDPTLRVGYRYDAGKRWGLIDTATRKKLTYATNGATNTTVIRIAGQSHVIGGLGGAFGVGGPTAAGKFATLPDDPAREARRRSSYTFFPRAGLRVTQILEIVPSKQPIDIGGGQQRRRMDTLLVRYLFENTGRQMVNAGLRLEVDTMIGDNDGVPFTVPGKGLVNTSADFTQADRVPDFVQALETGRIKSPGTVVHISLRVGGGIEAPSRVTLCGWNTNGNLSNIRATSIDGDSAVIMAWPDQNLLPGKSREMGYAYGLGSVTVADPGGTLGVTLGGNFDIGQSFTITAYVNKPVAGQTLALDLPPGLDRIKGEQIQRVAAPTVGDTSIVSWEAKVLQTGVFPVKVRSSTGITQTKTITIAQGNAPTGGKLAIDLQGSFEPGQVFTVVGKVNEPIENQTLTLHLPAGLRKIAGTDTQPVPAPPVGSKDAVVQWQVRVTEPGKYPVRVSSSTGIAQTKTITIVQPTRAEGAFQVLLTGDFVPGKTFTVSTKVVNPVPDQKLTLVLPAGLQRVDGTDSQIAQANVPLEWKVKIEQAGKFTVGVKSTTGVTQRKTVSIEPPSDQAGRFNFEFAGDIRPGKEFTVTARVTNPAEGQTLTLALPKGLQLVNGDARQPVPPAANPGGASTLTWNVRVIESGRLPVRIESSTGLARTKTITLSESKSNVF
jgi:hypothetical protein